MDWGLFALGILGALLTVYVARQEVIPEFRPFFDTSDKASEAAEGRERIKKTLKEIDDLEAKLVGKSVSPDFAQRLNMAITASSGEVESDRKRLREIEGEIKQSQILSRTIGFALYVILGGVFGALLAGRVKVEGLSGELPMYFQSIIIGATWTTYLSIIGLRSGQQKADERIEGTKKWVAAMIEQFKRDITPQVAEVVSEAEKAEKAEKPVLADELARSLGVKFDQINSVLQDKLDMTRQLVRRDVIGL